MDDKLAILWSICRRLDGSLLKHYTMYKLSYGNRPPIQNMQCFGWIVCKLDKINNEYNIYDILA